jgi:TusA-related sulfurtransferase
MTIETLDVRGLEASNCILKIAEKAESIDPSSILEVRGDCEGFEKDLRAWCEGTGRIFLSVEDEGIATKTIGIKF